MVYFASVLIKNSWQILANLVRPKSCDFLLLNINILILHYTSMQSKIDDSRMTDSLRRRIAKLEAENNKIKAENDELKAKVARLEDKQT